MNCCLHRFIDILEPTEAYSAADFRHDAKEMYYSRGKMILLVEDNVLQPAGWLSPLPAATMKYAANRTRSIDAWLGCSA